MTKAFSYLRFSTPEQVQGDSFRRQTDAARKYATTHGLELDGSLTFADLGVSAYRGKHATVGALSAFLEAVEAGQVKAGDYLLVENLDRLGRDDIRTARDRFEALILDKGINIVILSNNKVYSKDNYDLQDMLLTLLEMSRAHLESEHKSQRLKAAWHEKRNKAANDKVPLTSWCPGWLKLVDGKYELIPERVEVVRRIYDWALEGHGKTYIAKKLNGEGVPTFDGSSGRVKKPNGWYIGYVRKILITEAVIGRFRPASTKYVDGKRKSVVGDPIEKYFPAIIDKDKFYRVSKMQGASGYAAHDLANILSGLVTCHHCGGKLHFINKGGTRGGYYLRCDNAQRKGTCDAQSIRYDVSLTAVLRCLTDKDLDLRSLLDNGHKSRKLELQHQLEAVEGQITETEQIIQNHLNLLERHPDDMDIDKRYVAAKATLENLRQAKVTLEGDIADAANGDDPIKDIDGLIEKWSRDELKGDLKVRLNAALKRVIETIRIGHSYEAADWIGEHFIDNLTSKKDLKSKRHRERFAVNLDRGAVSIEVRFREKGRVFMIAADPKQPNRLAAASAVLEGDVRNLVKLEAPVFKSSNFKLLNAVVREQK